VLGAQLVDCAAAERRNASKMERDGHRDAERSGYSGGGAGKRRYDGDDGDRGADRGELRSERDEHDEDDDAGEQQGTKKVMRKRKSSERGASPDAGRLSRKEAVPLIKRWYAPGGWNIG
jgi:hypothetical protein